MKKSLSSSISHIDVIYAGGTFGSFGQPLAPLSAKAFLPILHQIMPNTTEIMLNMVDNSLIKDSSQFDVPDFLTFYRLILKHYAQGQRYFLLITGTDTLSYLGAFLAEAFANSDIRLVLTASMRPLLDPTRLTDYVINPQSDAKDNFHLAIGQLLKDKAGVYVAIGNDVWPAQTVQKLHSHDMLAFSGHQKVGYPASSYQDRLSQTTKTMWLEQHQPNIGKINHNNNHNGQSSLLKKPCCVQIIYALPSHIDAHADEYMKIHASQLRHIITQAEKNNTPTAVILMSYGEGNFPKSHAMQTMLNLAYQVGIMVINSSQALLGGVSDNYAAGSWLADCHVISGGRLTLPAIYARLLWLLLTCDSPKRRRQRWQHTVSQV